MRLEEAYSVYSSGVDIIGGIHDIEGGSGTTVEGTGRRAGVSEDEGDKDQKQEHFGEGKMERSTYMEEGGRKIGQIRKSLVIFGRNYCRAH